MNDWIIYRVEGDDSPRVKGPDGQELRLADFAEMAEVLSDAIRRHPDYVHQVDEFNAIMQEVPCAICQSNDHAAVNGDHEDAGSGTEGAVPN